MRVRTVGWLLTIVTALVVVTVTLLPLGTSPPMVWTHCVICGTRGLADALANVLLFLPLGVGLQLAGVPVRQAMLRGALASATIELSQMLLPGRDPNPGDVFFNTIGVGVGIALVVVTPRVARLSVRAAAAASAAAGAMAAVVVGLTGWLLQPQWPSTTYYGQWTPDLTYLEWYRGTVLTAAVGDAFIRSRGIDDTERVRGLLAAGAPIRVTAIAGPAPERLAPLFSIYDHRRIEIMLVGPDRDGLVYRYRTRSMALRLDQPDFRFRGALREVRTGDSLEVEVMPDPARRAAYCLAANGERRCGLGFTAGRGWAILYYVEWFPGWLQAALDWAWLAALFLPLGALARRRWETAAALLTAALALLLLPSAVGLLATPVLGYAGAAVGAAAGALATRRLRATPPAD
jgi:putative effector of murein hydrolase LrgA (UPF0299 family)